MALDGTYAGLMASVADFLNRADLTAAIPDFIALAEAQIGRRLVMDGPVRRMMARSDATPSIATEFVQVPNDFMGVRSFYLTENTIRQLQFCTPEEIVQRKNNTSQLTGCPKVFSVVGGEFQFFPAPVQSYPAELTYWQRIPSLATAGANWLLTLHPDAYLYGALLQSAPYLKDDNRISIWATALQTILADIVGADKVERTSTFLAMPHVHGGTP